MPRVSYKKRREFAAEILEHAFFGAFYTAIAARKKEEGLTGAQLGSRMGREKTGISKLLSGPRNWQLSTISDLSEALDLRVDFALVDRHVPTRCFTASGVSYHAPLQLSFNNLPSVNANSYAIAAQQTPLNYTGAQGQVSFDLSSPILEVNNSSAMWTTMRRTVTSAAATGWGVISAGSMGIGPEITSTGWVTSATAPRPRPAPALPPPGTAPIPTILGSVAS